MANVRCGNSFYVDAASSSALPSSFINKKQIQIVGIIFNSNAAGDNMAIADWNGSGAGSAKLIVSNGVAKDSKILTLFDTAIQFPNGIWIAGISSGATATLILADNGN
jgi:hypothetical protein